MGKKYNITIIDDEIKIEGVWQNNLKDIGLEKQGFEIAVLEDEKGDNSLDKIKEEARILLERQQKIRKGSEYIENIGNSVIDKTDVLIVDADLFNKESKIDDFIPSGEQFAYLARCFSSCGIIIVLNQYYTGKKFDLSLMNGHPESFADLNISGDELHSRGLWYTEWDDFRPWYWSFIPKALNDYQECIKQVENNIDEKIWDIIGFEKETIEILPTYALKFLQAGIRKKDLFELTFLDFATSADECLKPKDRKDGKFRDKRQLARIAAARIRIWLDKFILPAQNVFTDLPHIIQRMPFLLAKRDDLEIWNETASFYILKSKSVRTDLIEKYIAKESHWWSRPVWYWNRIIEDDEIRKLSKDASNKPDFIFCEDISRFMPREFTKYFDSDVLSAYKRRFICDRHNDKVEDDLRENLKDVNYDPENRLMK